MANRLNKTVDIAGVTFGNKLMNGAYIGSKSLDDVRLLANSSAGSVIVGSISVKRRTENAGLGYWRHKENFYSLNSYGMPNRGISYFKKHLPEMAKIAHGSNKPLIANVVGFSNEEFMELILLAQSSHADMVELNFGCPNVWDSGEQKRILSYHPDLVKDTLEFLTQQKPIIPICIKISPLPPDTLREVAEVIIKSKIVVAVTATNSYPNASTSTGTRVDSEDALAGMSGRALKPISLGVVKQLRSLLPARIDIIACGGISSKNDVIDYLEAGAKAVQIATALVDDGLKVFETILS